MDLADFGDRDEPLRTFHHPGIDARVRYRERFSYDPIRQILSTRMEFSPTGRRRPWTVLLAQRQWFPREVEALLHYGGFGPSRFLADFDPNASFEHVDTVAVQTQLRQAKNSAKMAGSA